MSMLLGTAVWNEGPAERRALVARLASGRLADLNRIEAVRLRKLGEGEPERLAEALLPASLRRVLEGGPRSWRRPWKPWRCCPACPGPWPCGAWTDTGWIA